MAVTNADHESLVLAFACDTVSASLACQLVKRIVVVTNDSRIQQCLASLGTVNVIVIEDAPAAGLNAAVDHGAAAARSLSQLDGLAALPGDLPALQPTDLADALTAASNYDRAFVSDLENTGTTLFTCRPGIALQPRYGVGSREAHLKSGAIELVGDWPSLRQDVDAPADLAAAVELGLGSATTKRLSDVGARTNSKHLSA